MMPRRSAVLRALRARAIVPRLAFVTFATGLPLAALAQRPNFGPTLYHESGLINIPAAYVAPLGGDVSFSLSRVTLGGAGASVADPQSTSSTLTSAISLWGRGEVGVSIYTGPINLGVFGKALLIDQTDGVWRRGLRHWLPSVAIGVRNVGGEGGLNRMAVTQSPQVNQSPTLYGVATRTTVLKADALDPTRPKVQFSASAGYGTGIFKEDGGLGTAYAPSATGGVFAGGSVDVVLGRYSSLSMMLEHDAWALNAGLRMDVQGFRLSLYRADLNGSSAAGQSFTAPKTALAIGWQGHILTILRGNRLEGLTARAEAQQGDLERQVRIAQQRIDAIQGQLNALLAVASAQRSAERADLERRLKEEQDAMQRLQDLIKARDAGKKPPMDGAW